MPVIKIDMFSGRSDDQKRILAKRFTDTYVEVIGGPAASVTIVFNEIEKSNWAVSGELISNRTAEANRV